MAVRFATVLDDDQSSGGEQITSRAAQSAERGAVLVCGAVWGVEKDEVKAGWLPA